MSTSAARSGVALGALGRRRVTGIEAGEHACRLAQYTRGTRGGSWRLDTLPLSAIDEGAASPLTRSQLRSHLRERGMGRSSAVCALSTPALEVFPLSFDARQMETIDASVVEQAQDRLSYPIQQAVLDYIEIPEWARRPAEWASGVLVYSIPRDHVEDLLDRLGGAGLAIERMLTPACALAPRLALGDPEEEPRQLLVSIGEEVTSISVVERAHVLLERILPWGAARLTRNAAAALSITEAQARSLLGRTGEEEPAGGSAVETRRIMGEILSGELDELARESIGCAGYCTSFLKSREIVRLALVGPFAENPSVTAFLQRALELPVVTLDGPAESVQGSAEPADPAYAMAASCALLVGGEAA